MQSISVNMQNIDTTLFSFQPDNSKWWCNGAILNNLLPPVLLKYITCNTTDSVSISASSGDMVEFILSDIKAGGRIISGVRSSDKFIY